MDLSKLFPQFDTTETTSQAREILSTRHAEYLAYQKKMQKILDIPLKDVVSPLTGKKFSETFMLTTSTGQHPQITIFPWFVKEGVIVSYARFTGIGAAIRGFVKGFGTLRYQTLKWHRHEISFDPTVARVPEVLSFTEDGKNWQFKGWQNGNYIFQPLGKFENGEVKPDEVRIATKVALHRELDFMLEALEWGHPFAIVLSREEHVAQFESKIASRLDLPVREVIRLIGEDAKKAKAEKDLGLRKGKGNTTADERPAVVGGIDLTQITKSVTVLAFLPRLTEPIEYKVDPAASNYQDVLDGIRNSNGSARFEIKP